MTNLPSSVDLRHLIKYLPSQENIPCCTASATLLSAEILMGSTGINIHFSRLYLYYMSRKIRDRLYQSGAELKDSLEALKTYGVCTDLFWPLCEYRVDREPSLQAISESIYKLQSYETVTTDLFKYYLSQGIPIIIGMHTGRLFRAIRGKFEDQIYKLINSTDNIYVTGHSVVIVGYDDNLHGGSWLIANSLGLKWGFRGYAVIPYECNTDIGEAYIITNFAGISVGKKIPKIDK